MSAIHLITDVPGPKSRALAARREAATSKGAAKASPIGIASAHGATVTDLDGNTLLDFAGGIGVLAVGHTPANVVEAIQRQAAELIHFCAIVGTYEPYVQVAEMMNALTPGDFPKKTVLLNSGSEANEAAVLIARAYTKRPAIVVFEGAYHGRTNLTLAMTSKYGLFKKGFGPFAPEIYRLQYPYVYRRLSSLSEEEFVEDAVLRLENALTAQVDPEAIAAIVIEPVQGEGGFVPTPPRFLERIREICTQYGIVMIADEVQCGFGRTGRVFACEHYAVVPDLVVSAKSIAAGMPLAAVTGRAEIMDAPHPGGLGGTYSGNPVACAAAIESIKMISDPAFLHRAQALGERMRGHLLRIGEEVGTEGKFRVGDVRGLGPMLILEFVLDDDKTPVPASDVIEIVQQALARGVICLRAGLFANCLRLLPPLNMTDDELDEGMAVIAEAIKIVAGVGAVESVFA